MFPKENQEIKILDESLGELDATVKHLENEILMKKKQFSSPKNLESVDICQISEVINQDMVNSPVKETRIISKNELDDGNMESNKEQFQINEAYHDTENFIYDEYIQNNGKMSKVASTNISPKRSKNLVIIDQNTESNSLCSNECESSANLNLIYKREGISLDLQGSIPIQLHQSDQFPLLQPQPHHHQSQTNFNQFMIHPMQIPPHNHGGAQLRPIPIYKQLNENFHLAPHASVFQPCQPQMHLNTGMQSIPGMLQSQHILPCNSNHNFAIPPVSSQNMQMPVPISMQMPMPMSIPMQMPAQMQVPIPVSSPSPVPMQVPNMNSQYLLAPSNMQMQFNPNALNQIGTPPPNIMAPSHIQAPISQEAASGLVSGIPGTVEITGQLPVTGSGPNMPNPLGMDSQMLAKYLLTAMAEECMNKKKSSMVQDGNLDLRNHIDIPEYGPTSISSTLFPSPNIRPLIQPPKVEIDFTSPTCFSQDVFKKKCKRKPKIANPNNNIPIIGCQHPFPDQVPIVANHGLNPELETNTDQKSQISPPSSPTCFSFKASVPVSILGDNPFSESITKIVTNKVSQCHPHQYMTNGNFSVKSEYNLPIHPQINH